MRRDAAERIAGKIAALEDVVTNSPSKAKRIFSTTFSRIVTGEAKFDDGDAKSNVVTTTVHYSADKDNLNKLFDGVTVAGTDVHLPGNVDVKRKLLIVPSTTSPTGYTYEKNPHVVDYVLCHIGGFRKFVKSKHNREPEIYTGGGKYPGGHVPGRDLIYTGVMLATPAIVQDIKRYLIQRAKHA